MKIVQKLVCKLLSLTSKTILILLFVLKRILYILSSVALFGSCSSSFTDELDDILKPDVSAEFTIASNQVAFSATTISTRTAIDDIDGGTVKWLTDDKICLWAYADGEEKISNVEFSLKYYGYDYSDAIFIGNVTDLTDPASVDYTYYAVHPTPDLVEGTVVSYNILPLQTGRYDDSACDPMLANAATAPAMQLGEKSDLELSFSHMAHIIRLQIPDERYNMDGTGVASINIEFPAPVANGYLSFDYKSGEYQEFTGSSNTIMVSLDEPTQGDKNYIWVFINPQTMSGDIKFRFYNDEGDASELITTTVTDYEFAAGHITPIDITVPEQVLITDIRMSIAGNNLGEDPNTVTFTAPSGTTFFDGSSSITYDYVASTAYEYSVIYETTLYGSTFKSKGITVTYDTDNAVVTSALSLSGVTDNKVNSFSDTLPYVIYEDFSSISYFSYHDNPGVGEADSDAAEGHAGVDLSSSSYGSLSTSGWTANRCGASAGGALRIMGRFESAMSSITGHYEGRLDSPQFAVLKDGAEVDMEVSFYYKGGRYSKYYDASSYFPWKWTWVEGGTGTGTFNYGYTTISGGIDGEDDIQNKMLESYEIIPNTEGGNSSSSQNYNSISNPRTFVIPSATNETRASWRVTNTMDDDNFFGANGNFWLYLDNIMIQIKK